MKKVESEPLNGFSPVSSTRFLFLLLFLTRKHQSSTVIKDASGRNLDKVTENTANETPNKREESSTDDKDVEVPNPASEHSERRRPLC
ncbi:hypothetical protein NC651_014687 [Populus alba x Populus x berolinensis]|nr:hypothetical protein NC651_014687 [Populus alba x Populus x berolinensis]